MKLEIKTEDLKEAGLLQEFATLFGLTTEELLEKKLFVKEWFPPVTKTEDEPLLTQGLDDVAVVDEPLLTPKDLVETIHSLAKALDLEAERRHENHKTAMDSIRTLRRNENTITKAIEKLGGDVKQVKDMRLADVNQFVRSRIALMGRLDALEKGARPTENEKTGLNL